MQINWEKKNCYRCDLCHNNQVQWGILYSFTSGHSTVVDVSQWNGTFHWPDPSYRAFGYCSCKLFESRIQKRGTGDNNLVQSMERDISVRPIEMTGRSKWTTLKGGSKYSGRIEPKWCVPFHWFLTEMSGIVGWMESAPNFIETGSMGVTSSAALPLFRSC